MLHSTESPDGTASSFQDRLLALWGDPAIWRIAVRRAGSRDLAWDALQETFYAIARVKDPQRIENLRAFFCTALIHEIDHQLWQIRPRPVENPETAAGDRHQGLAWSDPVIRDVDAQAIRAVLAQAWFSRFRRELTQLRATVPGRSHQPGRYRNAIVAVAQKILRAALAGHVIPADCNQELQAAQPEWFNEPGCPQDTLYQRLSRGRRDVQMLLQTVVDRRDLSQ